MDKLLNKNVLFFSPDFFNYDKEIKKCLENLGAKVHWFDDRPSNSFLSKVIIRFNRNYISMLTAQYYKRILEKVKHLKFDYVLFLNPEAINEDMLKGIKNFFPEAIYIVYMWDSFNNRKKTLDLLPFFNYKFTFDPKDSKQYNINHRPLFFIPQYAASNEEKQPIEYDLLFTGTAHSDRYILVKNICKKLFPGAKTKLYFYLSSKFLYLFRKLLDKNFKSVALEDLSFKSLSHEENAALILKSKAVLDINHPKQIGLTMRTFEVLGAGRKLITTNKDVENYDFYSPENILIIDRSEPKIDEKFFQTNMKSYCEDTKYKYSIEGWVMEIFNLKST